MCDIVDAFFSQVPCCGDCRSGSIVVPIALADEEPLDMRLLTTEASNRPGALQDFMTEGEHKPSHAFRQAWIGQICCWRSIIAASDD